MQDFDYVATVREWETLDYAPMPNDIPPTPFSLDANLGARYGGAFDVQDAQDAAIYLLGLVGHRLRFHPGDTRPTWQAAFRLERENLWWFGLMKDVSVGHSWNHETQTYAETTKARDFAFRFYGAIKPLWLTHNQQERERAKDRLFSHATSITAQPTRPPRPTIAPRRPASQTPRLF